MFILYVCYISMTTKASLLARVGPFALAMNCGIQKHQYERYLTHKIVMGDTFPLQELVKVSNGMERTQT